MRKLGDILSIKTNNIEPGKGKILISEPFLGDYYFKRSVVLLADHNEEGSFGLILNKPLDIKLGEVVHDFPNFEAVVYLGGPVESDNLFFIHTMGDQIEGSFEILNGLYWGGKMEVVKEMMLLKKINPAQIRFYIGYSGWSPNQLKEELERNAWVVSRTNTKLLMKTNADQLWETALHRLGGDYSFWPKFPIDPMQN
ncbi:MAG: transcriptional regulator [Bacteroidetes bacterium HGW-Bacteroidetes-17]|jgi:putative transcriptional regulator|nr:MAG: transcriptional regulator [Bacteroidetes bacterium HGW-Bacteroidetes-17]